MVVCIIIPWSCPSSVCRNSLSCPPCSGWWRCSRLKYIPFPSCTVTVNSAKNTEPISKTTRTTHSTSVNHCIWWVGSSGSPMHNHLSPHSLWWPRRRCCCSWQSNSLFLSKHPCPLCSPTSQSVSHGWWSSRWRTPSDSPPSLFISRWRSWRNQRIFGSSMCCRISDTFPSELALKAISFLSLFRPWAIDAPSSPLPLAIWNLSSFYRPSQSSFSSTLSFPQMQQSKKETQHPSTLSAQGVRGWNCRSRVPSHRSSCTGWYPSTKYHFWMGYKACFIVQTTGYLEPCSWCCPPRTRP